MPPNSSGGWSITPTQTVCPLGITFVPISGAEKNSNCPNARQAEATRSDVSTKHRVVPSVHNVMFCRREPHVAQAASLPYRGPPAGEAWIASSALELADEQ